MDAKAFVDTRMKRLMAQTLEEFETVVELPAKFGQQPTAASIDAFKREFRKRLQAFATDVSDVMPGDVEINGFELTRRGA